MVGLYLTMLEDPEDQQVFREFYETYHQAMFRAAYRVLGSRESAEDAVHDAFLAILELCRARIVILSGGERDCTVTATGVDIDALQL